MPPPSVGLNRRTLALLLIAALVLGVATWHRLWFAGLPGPVIEWSGPTMGTTFLVKVATPEIARERYAEVSRAIVAALDAVDQRMSSWNSASELSRFNAQRSSDPFAFSPDVIAVFEAARRVSERSGGAFDVTVAPLVRAWGFGSQARIPGGPDPGELETLRRHVGWRLLRIDATRGTVAKTDPETLCDLSAIAKGHAVDRLAEQIGRLGYDDYLVEIGGELRARGLRPDGQVWRVAIEVPSDSPGSARRVHLVLPLRDASLATSGDYRSYYEQDGVRISHTIDPRSGRPIRHRLASVTVVHPEAMLADAWATALNVLGPEEGLTVAEAMDLPVHFISRAKGGTFSTVETTRFSEMRSRPQGQGAE